MKRLIVFSLLLAVIAAFTGYALTSLYQEASHRVVWFTYKYKYDRKGFIDIHRITDRSYTFIDYTVYWKTKANLCVASSPVIADLNDDGVLEVAYSSCDGYFYVVNAVNGSILWKYGTGGGFADPTVWDPDDDGELEIVVNGHGGNIYCFEGDGSLKWVYNGRMFAGNPIVLDFDGDGVYEVLGNSNDGYIYVLSSDGALEYKVKVGDLPVSTLSAVDVDGDGLLEVACVEGSYFHIVDYSDNKPIVYSIDTGRDLVGPPVLTDLYGNGDVDAIFLSRDGWIYILDVNNGTILYSRDLGVEDVGASPSIGDVTGDGVEDIVVGSMEGLYVLDKKLEILRNYTELQIYASSPIISDIDNDGINEIIVGTERGEILVISAVKLETTLFSEIEYMYNTGGPIMASAAIADVDGDGLPEFLMGSRDFYMYCFKGVPIPVEETTTIVQNTTTYTMTTTITTSTPTTSQNTYTSTTGEKLNTSTTKGIKLPRTTGSYTPRLNIMLIMEGVIAMAIIIAIVYYITRR